MLYEISSLTRTFGREVTALDAMDLTIREGELVCVTGPSGSGKSTLLHILGLLDPGFDGIVKFRGRSVRRLPEAEASRLRLSDIGFVFQRSHLLPGVSALDNVALPHWHLHGDRAAARARAQTLLESMGLGSRAKHDSRKLSGGELQRIAMARALVNDPPVVLADEPTGNLDARATELVIELLARVRDAVRSVIVVSHDRAVVEKADRVIELHYGSLPRPVQSSMP